MRHSSLEARDNTRVDCLSNKEVRGMLPEWLDYNVAWNINGDTLWIWSCLVRCAVVSKAPLSALDFCRTHNYFRNLATNYTTNYTTANCFCEGLFTGLLLTLLFGSHEYSKNPRLKSNPRASQIWRPKSGTIFIHIFVCEKKRLLCILVTMYSGHWDIIIQNAPKCTQIIWTSNSKFSPWVWPQTPDAIFWKYKNEWHQSDIHQMFVLSKILLTLWSEAQTFLIS